jgi:hypothetical protein
VLRDSKALSPLLETKRAVSAAFLHIYTDLELIFLNHAMGYTMPTSCRNENPSSSYKIIS